MSKRQFDDEYNFNYELKKSHTVISEKKKERLIKLVQQGLTIYKAAKLLSICHPTAKFIMKCHRQRKHSLSSLYFSNTTEGKTTCFNEKKEAQSRLDQVQKQQKLLNTKFFQQNKQNNQCYFVIWIPFNQLNHNTLNFY